LPVGEKQILSSFIRSELDERNKENTPEGDE
jgi:hypothetical protein